MPLSHGKSEKAFSKNVSTEMHHGKPQRQALAIAYALKRRAQHKAHGGEMCAAHGAVACEHCYAKGGVIDRNRHEKGINKEASNIHERAGESVAGMFTRHENEDDENEKKRI